MKPQLTYQDGKLLVSANAGVDADHDGKNSIEASVSIKIDAMEAVSEIIKDEVPAWLNSLISAKLTAKV